MLRPIEFSIQQTPRIRECQLHSSRMRTFAAKGVRSHDLHGTWYRLDAEMILQRLCALFLLPWVCLGLDRLGLDNGLAMTPQMGWNSWNHFGCNINQTIIEETADAFVSTGLKTFGYEYVNVDDCWAKSRDSLSIIQPDNTTFPDFQGMIDYVHSKGLKFGLYSDAGNKTCAGRPVSLGY